MSIGRLLLAVIFGAFLLGGAQAAPSAIINQFEILKVDWRNFKFNPAEGISGNIIITFANKTNLNAPITRIISQLYFNNTPLAAVNVNSPLVIPANGTQEVVFNLNNSTSNLLQAISTILGSGTFTPNFSLRGTATVNGVQIPFNKNISTFG